MPTVRALIVISTLIFLTDQALAEDIVEFLNGSAIRGKVTAIRKEIREFDLEASVNGRAVTRTYRYDEVEAVTIQGKRCVLNAKTSSANDASAADSDRNTNDPAGQAAADSRSPPSPVSPGDIERLIESKGSSPPDWYDDVPLQYPKTLDLSWPLKPPGKDWQADKYVFHYLWSNVYPNPGRWQSGAKLVHHIVTLYRQDRVLLARDMCELGHMYFRLFQDYPRAAFWYRKSGVEKGTPPSVHLAECCWRLGSKAMALEELKARTVPLDAIKLYSDMGETERAVKLAEAFAGVGQSQFYSALVDIPRQIVSKQSIQNIDAVSGATVTSQAIVNGTAKALTSAPR